MSERIQETRFMSKGQISKEKLDRNYSIAGASITFTSRKGQTRM